VTVHGRTAADRYSRAADWDIIQRVVEDGVAVGGGMAVIGNGDIANHAQAKLRMDTARVDAVMVGRGALTKPWLFGEFRDGAAWGPDARERVEIYRRLTCYMKEYFGDDERGRRKAWNFLPWHFDFFCRYRPELDDETALTSLQTRYAQGSLSLPPVDRLLTYSGTDVHELIAAALWEASSDQEAFDKLSAVAEGPQLAELILAGKQAESSASGEQDELANIPSSEVGPGQGAQRTRRKHRRAPAVQRTDEEIAELRAARAEKRRLLGTPAHVDGFRK